MKFRFILALLACGFLVSCASVKQAELASSNPNQALDEVSEMRADLLEMQADLTAHQSFEKAERYFQEAREGLNEGDKIDSVLKDLRVAKAYFIQARADTNSRNQVPDRLLDARKHVLDSNVDDSFELSKKLSKVDSDLRIESDNFSESLSAEDFSDFQKRYLDLEVLATQNTHLGKTREMISQAMSRDADFLAPRTLKTARTDLSAAENLIQQNVRKPKSFRSSVVEAEASALLLSQVTEILQGEAKGSSESVALKLVAQERQLGNLKSAVGALASEVVQKDLNMALMSQELESKDSKLLSREKKIKFQEAMKAVQKDFTNEEAEVYQQSDKLLLRLKNINFKFDSASIPEESESMLTRISRVIKDLEPRAVTVEGHTDSIGDEEYNKGLSKKRAEAVSEFLKSTLQAPGFEIASLGEGESDPIANNETREGRSQNRRVDIVLDAK